MPKSNSQRQIDCRTSREHLEDDSNIAGSTLAGLWGVEPVFFANFICEIPDFPEMVALAGLEPYYPAHDALNAMIALAERDETVEALANYGEGTPVADLKPAETEYRLDPSRLLMPTEMEFLGDKTDRIAAQLPNLSKHEVILDERGYVSGIRMLSPGETPQEVIDAEKDLFAELRRILSEFPDTTLSEHGISIKRETGEWRWLAEAITQALIREGRDKAAKSFTDGIETKAVSIGISQAFLGHLAAVLDEVER